MQAIDGILFPIVITALHLANFAPSFLYSSILSERPSRPSVIFSFSWHENGFAPASTFIPGMIPTLSKCSEKDIPFEVFCFIVSSKSMAPDI